MDNAKQKEAIDFLKRDFEQCFEQMRYYDNQINSMCKFIWTAYTALFAFIIGCQKYALDNQQVANGVRWACLGALIVAIALGLCLYGIIVRNRVYFVIVTRYINEHRGFFLETRPLGFNNESGIYVEWQKVPYFNPMGSQSFFMYITCFLNGIIIGLISYLLLNNQVCLLTHFIVGIISFFLLLTLTIIYLKSKEGKKGAGAVGHNQK